MDFETFSYLQAAMDKETRQKGAKEDFDEFENIVKNGSDCKVCIVLDWLSVLFIDEQGEIAIPENEDVRQVTDILGIKYYGKGTEHYKYISHLLYNGEHVATILSHTRNEKFVRKGSVKVDFKNHLLYSSDLWKVYDLLVEAFHLKYKNISRVDIAIDGINYLMEFINKYVKQHKGGKVVEMKGRPRINCKVLDRKQMLYQNFNIGVKPKFITVYNKSLDIVKTGKNYIQDMWLKNGVCKELLPIEVLSKAMNDEKMYLDGYENIFRFETRLGGTIIASIKNFSIDWLKTPDMLMSIVKRTNQNFFEFVWYTFSDVSKCKPIDIMPYHLYSITNIDLEKAAPRDDLYKTKLSLKKNVRQLYLGNLTPDDYAATEMIIFDVVNFNLQHWFLKRVPGWMQAFGEAQPDNEYRATVDKLLLTLAEKFSDRKEYEMV